MLASIIDDLEMQAVPAFLGEEPLQVSLGRSYVFPTGQTPALSEPVDMRIHRESGQSKGLRHNDGGCLVTNSRQLLQFFEGARYFTPVLFH